MTEYGVTSITFTGGGTAPPTSPTSPTISTTPIPTSQISSIIATKSLYSSKNFDITVNIDLITNNVRLTINGPSNVWFGVGFGGSIMSGTYSIICSGSNVVQERKLGDHEAGSILTSSITVESDTISGTTRTVILTRDRIGMDRNYSWT